MNSITVKDAAGVDRTIGVTPAYKEVHITGTNPTDGGASDITTWDGATLDQSLLLDTFLAAVGSGVKVYRIPVREAGFSGLAVRVKNTSGLSFSLALGLPTTPTYGGIIYITQEDVRLLVGSDVFLPAKPGMNPSSFPYVYIYFTENWGGNTGVGSIELHIYRW